MTYKERTELMNNINRLEELIHAIDKKTSDLAKARNLYVEKLVAANAKLEKDN